MLLITSRINQSSLGCAVVVGIDVIKLDQVGMVWLLNKNN